MPGIWVMPCISSLVEKPLHEEVLCNSAVLGVYVLPAKVLECFRILSPVFMTVLENADLLALTWQ